ncbi:MAG: ABC transporter permease, partial [Planctomycetales bacterium]
QRPNRSHRDVGTKKEIVHRRPTFDMKTPTNNSRIVGLMQSQGSLVTLLALCAVASVCFPHFRTPENLANVFKQVSFSGVVSLGMAFVILSGGIDLSVGSIAAVAGVLAARLSGQFGPIVVLVPVFVGVCLGAINGTMVTRMKITPFIATLAMMLGARGLALKLAGPGGESIKSNTAGWFSQVAKGDILGIPYRGILFILALGLAIIISKRTSFGRSIYAIGGNEEAARMMGLNVNRSKMLVYMICGGCAALAGTLLASMVDSGQPTAAVGWELTAIAAVVIGGTSLCGGIGKMSHTLYGVLILGVISNIITQIATSTSLKLTALDTNVVTGTLLLVVVLLQSRIANQTSTVGGVA